MRTNKNRAQKRVGEILLFSPVVSKFLTRLSCILNWLIAKQDGASKVRLPSK